MDCINKPYRISVINGPNLNRLGRRDAALYGSRTLEDINAGLEKRFAGLCRLDFYQSNHEGALIDRIQSDADAADCAGIVINPGAYAHTSLALADALADFALTGKTIVEVHISDIFSREPIRRTSLTSIHADRVLTGSVEGYADGIDHILNNMQNTPRPTCQGAGQTHTSDEKTK